MSAGKPQSHARKVTDQDICGMLLRLSALPRRHDGQDTSDLEAFREALDGIRVDVLSLALLDIMRGALGHGFHPSPPELRLYCNRLIEHRAERIERAERERRAREESARLDMPQPSPEAKARVQKMVDDFKKGLGA